MMINGFGRLAISVDGEYCTLNNRKAVELISYLLCECGKPVRKETVASVLWEDSDKEAARDSLYKVCRYIRDYSFHGEKIPVYWDRGHIWMDIEQVDSDVVRFKALTDKISSVSEPEDLLIKSYIEATNIYVGTLLYENCYDWINEYEAFYDMRFLDICEILTSYYDGIGNKRMADHYRDKL